MTDRTEKLAITRSTVATVVRLTIIESGITVNFSVKTYEHNLAESIQTAKKGCNRLLEIASQA